MTPSPEDPLKPKTKSDPDSLTTFGSFDHTFYDPDILRELLATARKWRQVLSAVVFSK
jgi:hypothetical protein